MSKPTFYGKEFPEGTNRLSAEIYFFSRYKREREKETTILPQDRRDSSRWNAPQSKYFHFCNIVDLLWNWKGESSRRVIWNEWTHKMLRGMVENPISSYAGCASSGKSDSAAVYAIIKFLSFPNNTCILITSTTIAGAQKRVWKSVMELWSALDDRLKAHADFVASKAQLRGYNKEGERSDSVGIFIVPAGSGSEQDAYDTLIGIKQDHLVLIADELAQLPRKVVEAAFGNLVNGSIISPFQMIAMSNPAMMTDAFGIMCKPKKGWDSVTEADEEWETDRGKVFRFDAEKSPNMIAGADIYPWLPKKRAIEAAKKTFGERSSMFYRQYKAFWFREASTETIYSINELIMARVDEKWIPEQEEIITRVIPVAAADPAFTQGGDRFPFLLGRVIETSRGKNILELDKVILLEEDVTSSKPRSQDMVMQLRALCSKNGVSPDRFAYDGTGTGLAFRDIVVADWSSLPMDVQFGGKATEGRAGVVDERKASEVFYNKVSEIWIKGKGLIREGRVKNIPAEVIEEMCARRYHTKNRHTGGKLRVESKIDMKAREGYSPDLADALFILIFMCIELGLLDGLESEKVLARSENKWNNLTQAQNDIGIEFLSFQ